MTPEAYLRLRDMSRGLCRAVESFSALVVFPDQKSLRPATPADIRAGVVLYFPLAEEPYWQLVVEVYDDSFLGDDGCRLQLKDAFVRKS